MRKSAINSIPLLPASIFSKVKMMTNRGLFTRQNGLFQRVTLVNLTARQGSDAYTLPYQWLLSPDSDNNHNSAAQTTEQVHYHSHLSVSHRCTFNYLNCWKLVTRRGDNEMRYASVNGGGGERETRATPLSGTLWQADRPAKPPERPAPPSLMALLTGGSAVSCLLPPEQSLAGIGKNTRARPSAVNGFAIAQMPCFATNASLDTTTSEQGAGLSGRVSSAQSTSVNAWQNSTTSQSGPLFGQRTTGFSVSERIFTERHVTESGIAAGHTAGGQALVPPVSPLSAIAGNLLASLGKNAAAIVSSPQKMAAEETPRLSEASVQQLLKSLASREVRSQQHTDAQLDKLTQQLAQTAQAQHQGIQHLQQGIQQISQLLASVSQAGRGVVPKPPSFYGRFK